MVGGRAGLGAELAVSAAMLEVNRALASAGDWSLLAVPSVGRDRSTTCGDYLGRALSWQSSAMETI